MLKQLFISEVRVKMFELFLLQIDPEKGMHVREITRHVGTEINAVRRELNRLTRVKMVKREQRGNRVYYKLREDFPLKSELLSMVAKESGLGKRIIDNQSRLGKIRYAILSKEYLLGRIAKSTEVDLLIVGTVSVQAAQIFLKEEERKRGHEINFTVLGEEEFDFRKQKRDSFIKDILVQPYVMLIGDEIEFASFL
jgi:DNA-binding transcriptional ArsR family regulator